MTSYPEEGHLLGFAGHPAVQKDGTLLTLAPGFKSTSPTILTVENPKVPSHQYRLVGKIKYKDVTGDGYLELQNYFPGQGMYFTRTLATDGFLGKIDGTSDWRVFQLPFFSKPGMLPNKLIVKLVLPASRLASSGRVWLTPLKMEAIEPTETVNLEETPSSSFPWSLVAAILSGIVGVLGTLVALLAGNPALRRPAFFATMLLVPCSFAALLAGVVLWSQEAGQNVWYPSIVIGGIWVILFAATAFVLRRKLAREELQTATGARCVGAVKKGKCRIPETGRSERIRTGILAGTSARS